MIVDCLTGHFYMSFELNSGLFTILRPCQHNKGYKDDQSQIQVH